MSLASEFKEFAMKGNVVDMAVGIIIGAAFGKIVSSLVDAIVMPALGWVIGGVNFTDLSVALGTEALDGRQAQPGPITFDEVIAEREAGAQPYNAATSEPVSIRYGLFVQALVDFLIIAFAIFVALKGINRLKKPPQAAAPPPPREEVLLTEIRDLLRQR
ncbi:MAG: large-conductance mechanosensitive channel protein MscL [Gammaproteobacteria bacterium]|nr:large-conductance mechanosensitive channel protein MscL [Gammaproteobacteria bacterium]